MAGPSKNKTARAAGDQTAQEWFTKRKAKNRAKAKAVKKARRRNRK